MTVAMYKSIEFKVRLSHLSEYFILSNSHFCHSVSHFTTLFCRIVLSYLPLSHFRHCVSHFSIHFILSHCFSFCQVLPVGLRSSFGLDTFAKHLKTHLQFGLAYSRRDTLFWVCITFCRTQHSDSVTKQDYYYYYYYLHFCHFVSHFTTIFCHIVSHFTASTFLSLCFSFNHLFCHIVCHFTTSTFLPLCFSFYHYILSHCLSFYHLHIFVTLFLILPILLKLHCFNFKPEHSIIQHILNLQILNTRIGIIFVITFPVSQFLLDSVVRNVITVPDHHLGVLDILFL